MIIASKIRTLAIPTLMVVALFSQAGTCRAGFIAGDLGTNGSFDTSNGYTLSGGQSSAGIGYGLAVKFQISGTSSVAFGSAQLALEFHNGTNAVDVLLMSDSSGLPGSALETIHLTGVPVGPSLVTAISTVHTMLAPSTTYWLVAVASNNTYMSWMSNTQGRADDLAYRLDLGSGPQGWQAASGNPDVAFSISAAAVPAPSSLSLFGLGLLSLGGSRLKRGRWGR